MCQTCIESATALSDKSQELMVFGGSQILTSAMETKARKAIIDFKFDALYQ